MRTAASGTGMETHGSAWLVIDCYPLAQLKTTFHLYDKQLHLIQAPVLCRLFTQHVLKTLYPAFFHPRVWFFFLSLCFPELRFPSFEQPTDKGGRKCKTGPSNWLPVLSPLVSAICSVAFSLTRNKNLTWPEGNSAQVCLCSLQVLFTSHPGTSGMASSNRNNAIRLKEVN